MARSTAQGSKRARERKQNLIAASKQPASCATSPSEARPPSMSPVPVSAVAQPARPAVTSLSTPPTTLLNMPTTPEGKISWRRVIKNWIISKLQKPFVQPRLNQLDSKQLKCQLIRSLHRTALLAVIIATAFCMYLLVSPRVDLQIKAVAAALFGYVVRKFVVFLTRITL